MTQLTETDIKQALSRAESNVDEETCSSLELGRSKALKAQNRWFDEYRSAASGGVAIAMLLVAVYLPINHFYSPSANPDVVHSNESLQLMMEDPEFFLWVSNSYSAISP